MAEKSDTRLKNIDALKGFIIILVVLGHVLNGYLRMITDCFGVLII